MKRTLAIILALALCFGITACAAQPQSDPTLPITPTQNAAPETTAPPEETIPMTYTYKVTPMQNVGYCVYYPYGANVPNSSDPAAAWDKITVWTQCPKCFEEDVGKFRIDPAQLDFSQGDTVQYSGIDSCFDCKWDYDMEQFMWVILVTRVPE